ncbi:MAG: ribosome biogenesis GTP-binding protein YihA/YsxC [Akkermansiaceae bacterium]|nr:ribosome biogenesis GTP-binding protein YihA/YsxC [Akkermansiaceae bacterium]
MQIKSAEFVTSAAELGECPEWAHPEVAFIGRSNVGKSSIINLLTGRHGLAKVSSTPGKTRLLNFFLINNQWGLVDLPGYGFAKGPRAEQDRFNELVAEYLMSRPQLRQLFVLIDARHSPQKNDLEFLSRLTGTDIPFCLVFTKTDKLNQKKARANARQFLAAQEEITGREPAVVMTSAKTREGRNELLGLAREAMEL